MFSFFELALFLKFFVFDYFCFVSLDKTQETPSKKNHHALICFFYFFLCFMNVSFFDSRRKHFLETMTSRPMLDNFANKCFITAQITDLPLVCEHVFE